MNDGPARDHRSAERIRRASASPPTGASEPGVSEGRLPITAKPTESDGHGEVSLVTSFNPLSFLLTLTHTTVELDGEHHRAPWDA